MNTDIETEPEVMSDASLVELSLAGNRNAFGQIVTRYQSPICALAYSACGNVARSEDMAQEIFLAAWRKLSTLREPGKFKAWLYGIARNIIHGAFRENAHNPAAGTEWEADSEPVATDAEPDVQVISKEEETIMWHVLSGMPVIYREPMVLYYRQEESIPEVAEVMGISEESVRQRLSRGRAMLNERVTRVVENGLRLTRPSDAFALAVVAALPMLAAVTTAKGAVMGAATTKTAGPATGLMAVLKAFGVMAAFVAVPAMIGTLFGFRLGRDARGTPQQQRSAQKFWRVFGLGLMVFLFTPLLLAFGITGFLHDTDRIEFLLVMTYWLGLAYPFVLISLVYWDWMRRRRQPAPAKRTETATDREARMPAAIPTASKEMAQEEATIVAAEGRTMPVRRTSRRWLLFLTVAVAGILVFLLKDTHYNVKYCEPQGLLAVAGQNSSAHVKAYLEMYHERCLLNGFRPFWESPDWSSGLLVEVTRDGKTTAYYNLPGKVSPDTVFAQLKRKGVNCQIVMEGRDYEVLGTPGRMLIFLLAFVLGMGVLYLLTGRGREMGNSAR